MWDVGCKSWDAGCTSVCVQGKHLHCQVGNIPGQRQSSDPEGIRSHQPMPSAIPAVWEVQLSLESPSPTPGNPLVPLSIPTTPYPSLPSSQLSHLLSV